MKDHDLEFWAIVSEHEEAKDIVWVWLILLAVVVVFAVGLAVVLS